MKTFRLLSFNLMLLLPLVGSLNKGKDCPSLLLVFLMMELSELNGISFKGLPSGLVLEGLIIFFFFFLNLFLFSLTISLLKQL